MIEEGLNKQSEDEVVATEVPHQVSDKVLYPPRRAILRDGRVYFALALILASLVAPVLITNDFVLDIIILSLMWAAFGVAWQIVGGYAGKASLGHGAFFGLGAYATAILYVRLGLSPWIGMLLGALFAGAIGAVIAALTFRLRGPFFILATIAFQEVVRIIAVTWRSLTGGTVGLLIPFRPDLENFMFQEKNGYLFVAAVMLAAFYLYSSRLQNSKLGFYLVSGGVDDAAARALGVNTFRSRVVGTFISAALSAVVGTFYAQYLLILVPEAAFSIFLSVQVALVTIVGGLYTPIGPIVGAFLLIPLAQILRGSFGGSISGLHIVIYSIILIVVLLFMPEGLVPAFARLIDRIRRRTE